MLRSEHTDLGSRTARASRMHGCHGHLASAGDARDVRGPSVVRFLAILVLTLACGLAAGCQETGSATSTAPTIAINVDATDTSASLERQRWAQTASWAPGQLQEHFSKHGREGPYATIRDYDSAARDTIIAGATFTYVDRESRAPRLGFYHGGTNRFTSLTADGQRITTFFHPDRRDSYVRSLDRSTFK
jgi:hypothetical protein